MKWNTENGEKRRISNIEQGISNYEVEVVAVGDPCVHGITIVNPLHELSIKETWIYRSHIKIEFLFQ